MKICLDTAALRVAGKYAVSTIMFLLFITPAISKAEQTEPQYEAVFVHRYANSEGVTIWDITDSTVVSAGNDGVNMRHPTSHTFFISLSEGDMAHVFYHGKDRSGTQWLAATKTFPFKSGRTEEIILQDQSKLYVTVNAKK